MTSKDHRQHWMAIVEDLLDPAPWLIYADRLEELGSTKLPPVMRRSRLEGAKFNADGSITFELVGMRPLLDHEIRIQGDGLTYLRQGWSSRRPVAAGSLSVWNAAVIAHEAGILTEDELRERLGLPPLSPAPRAPGAITPAVVNRAFVPRLGTWERG